MARNTGEAFKASSGLLYVQPDGPNADVQAVLCADLGDISDSFGDVTSRYCQRTGGQRGYMTVSRERGVPDNSTTSVTVPTGPVRNWFEKNMDCPMPLYIVQNRCNRPTSILDYEKVRVFPGGVITGASESNTMMRESGELTEEAYELTAEGGTIRIWPLVRTREANASVLALNAVAFCGEARCAGPCGAAQEGCLLGFAGGDAANLAAADVYYTLDGGTTWVAYANQPWIAGGAGIPGNQVQSLVCFRIDGRTRVMATRDNADTVGAALDVAFSDDLANWTNVVIGAGADIATGPQALFALDASHIWVAWSNGAGAIGYISFSGDGGLTWTAQETAAGDSLNGIRFCDANHGIAVGDTEEILITSDGGTAWAAPAGLPGKAAVDIQCCDIIDPMRMWVGFEDGDLYYTEDGGATWSERMFSMPAGVASTTFQIRDLRFVNEYVGYFALQFETGGPVTSAAIYRTFDGGRTWEYYRSAETGGQLNAIAPCHENKVFAVGEVAAGTAEVDRFEVA